MILRKYITPPTILVACNNHKWLFVYETFSWNVFTSYSEVTDDAIVVC